jgi:hypothetical protein
MEGINGADLVRNADALQKVKNNGKFLQIMKK